MSSHNHMDPTRGTPAPQTTNNHFFFDPDPRLTPSPHRNNAPAQSSNSSSTSSPYARDTGPRSDTFSSQHLGYIWNRSDAPSLHQQAPLTKQQDQQPRRPIMPSETPSIVDHENSDAHSHSHHPNRLAWLPSVSCAGLNHVKQDAADEDEDGDNEFLLDTGLSRLTLSDKKQQEQQCHATAPDLDRNLVEPLMSRRREKSEALPSRHGVKADTAAAALSAPESVPAANSLQACYSIWSSYKPPSDRQESPRTISANTANPVSIAASTPSSHLHKLPPPPPPTQQRCFVSQPYRPFPEEIPIRESQFGLKINNSSSSINNSSISNSSISNSSISNNKNSSSRFNSSSINSSSNGCYVTDFRQQLPFQLQPRSQGFLPMHAIRTGFSTREQQQQQQQQHINTPFQIPSTLGSSNHNQTHSSNNNSSSSDSNSNFNISTVNSSSSNSSNSTGPLPRFSARYHGMHTESNASAEYLSPEENTSLWITNLPPDITHHELLAQIRNIGRVYAVFINGPDGIKHTTAAAKIVFFHPRSAQRLLQYSLSSSSAPPRLLPPHHPSSSISTCFPSFCCPPSSSPSSSSSSSSPPNFHAATNTTTNICCPGPSTNIAGNSGGLLIRGFRAKVTQNRIKTPQSIPRSGSDSRVLIVTGQSHFVNEATLTRYFGDRFVFQVDEVRELIRSGGGGSSGSSSTNGPFSGSNCCSRSVVEYRFGSYRCQAQMGKMSLEKDRPVGFEKAEFGDDPCEVGETYSALAVAVQRIQGIGI